MNDKIQTIQIINNFFRGVEMDNPMLKVLQENYNKELKSAAEQPGGCSKCKKNAIRRRFKKLIVNHLNSKDGGSNDLNLLV
tara:strand:+ start:538 stop:780 length:243 start_codon:yes stop_codon:yes gene_type:complete